MPRADLPLCSVVELEIGGNLPARSVELLKREGLLDAPEKEAVRGGRPLYGIHTQESAAVTGALFAASGSIVLAGKLSRALLGELRSRYGRPPSGLDRYREIGRHLSSAERDEDGDLNIFAVHRLLRRHPEVFTPYEARSDDFRIFIVDQSFVFSGSTANIPIVSPFGNPSAPLTPEFTISGWRRGATENIEVTSFEESISPKWHDHPEGLLKAQATEQAAMKAWSNAATTVAVNISLTIRNSFDRIYDHRHGIKRDSS